jgi:hypothetical protein
MVEDSARLKPPPGSVTPPSLASRGVFSGTRRRHGCATSRMPGAGCNMASLPIENTFVTQKGQ